MKKIETINTEIAVERREQLGKTASKRSFAKSLEILVTGHGEAKDGIKPAKE